jgi:hypothetical protein
MEPAISVEKNSFLENVKEIDETPPKRCVVIRRVSPWVVAGADTSLQPCRL